MSNHLLNLKMALEYILDNEKQDYEDWCLDNDYSPSEYPENSHVYAYAILAWNVYFN